MAVNSLEGKVFGFTDETGKVNHIGPVIQTVELEKILAEKLNESLIPVINSLVCRVEELTSALKVRSLRSIVDLIATPDGGTLRNLIVELQSSLKPLEANVDSVLGQLRQNNPEAMNSSFSDSPTNTNSTTLQYREPFVTVKVGETEYPYFLTISVWRQIGGCNTPRTIARVVLESLHTVKEMREFTLTGKGVFKRFKENDPLITENNPVEENSRKPIPPESVEIALAVVAKVMDKSLRSKYENKVNNDGYNPYIAQVKELKKSTRGFIRSILQAYRTDYDQEGKRVAKKLTYVPLQVLPENILAEGLLD